MTTAVATRVVHRFKLHPSVADGLATIEVRGHAPKLLNVTVDLSGDLCAFVELAPVIHAESTPTSEMRFAVLRTGWPIPEGAAYLSTERLVTLEGPVIVHVFAVA